MKMNKKPRRSGLKYVKNGYVKHHGDEIVGLKRRPDGRFYAAKQPTKTFGKDPALAVHKFRFWEAEQESPNTYTSPVVEQSIVGSMAFDEARDYYRNLILNDPKQAAIELDVPHLADYPAKPTTPQMTLVALGEKYRNEKRNKRTGKPICGQEQRHTKQWWREFRKIVTVKYAKEITEEHIDAYHAWVMTAFDKGMSTTWVKHRFGKIRTLFGFAIKKNIDTTECQRVLTICKRVLDPPTMDAANPVPIDPTDFQKLLDVADRRETAVLLLALNCCLHSGELNIAKSEIDCDKGLFISNRTKTGLVRTAALWDRTVEAIRAYQKEKPNKAEYLFMSRTGMPVAGQVVRQMMKTLREKAGIEHVQFQQIRDGAYTAAIEGGAQFQHVQILAGHKTGMADRYIKRNPKMVADACRQIEKAYFGKTTKAK